jgi:hypothetical protein
MRENIQFLMKFYLKKQIDGISPADHTSLVLQLVKVVLRAAQS